MATFAETPVLVRDEDLDGLLLRVAQRADELSRSAPIGNGTVRDRQTWDLAEGELLRAMGAPLQREC